MTVEQRSATMSRIRGRDTGPERRVAALLQALGHSYEMQARDLPGRPDFVLRHLRTAVMVDGDFWHGWKFNDWKHKLHPKWRDKIAGNIRRDRRNRAMLREQGWSVIRIWEHQIKRSPAGVRRRLREHLRSAGADMNLASAGEAVKSPP